VDSATGDRVTEYSWYPGVDKLHAVMKDVAGTRYYAHSDALGSVLALTNETPAVTSVTNYDEWGKQIAWYYAQSNNRAQFKGALRFQELDLYYMRNRWYDPSTGRFLSEDPSGFNTGVTPYAFAGDDPINYSDPTGLQICYDEVTRLDGVEIGRRELFCFDEGGSDMGRHEGAGGSTGGEGSSGESKPWWDRCKSEAARFAITAAGDATFFVGGKFAAFGLEAGFNAAEKAAAIGAAEFAEYGRRVNAGLKVSARYSLTASKTAFNRARILDEAAELGHGVHPILEGAAGATGSGAWSELQGDWASAALGVAKIAGGMIPGVATAWSVYDLAKCLNEK
jgi:RHS repeat-associated protein